MNENARYNLLAAISFNDAANAGSTPEELVDAYCVEVLHEAIDAVGDREQRRAASGRDALGWESARDVLARMADKLSRGAVRPPLSKGPNPLVVSRFDVAMEPAPEEEQILTIGCIDEDGRPVALVLDMEARSKVARWLAPELNDTGRAATT
ncbi:hypothetical protein ACFVS9_27960 [Streptomyces sp. NPDC058008]|uniref:hypothetical protein n=1 Tax=Streptomyces sp. NPDC058008 TaxID=3346303 RepID=UPI0036E7222E